MQLIAELVVWISLGAIAASYVVYPLALATIAFIKRKPVANNDGTSDPARLSSLTLVISAYNETEVIREKIENSLSLDYPNEKLQVMVISDGSDDGTDEIVAEYADRGVLLCRLQSRRGKSAGLSQFVPQADGDVIVFSDANSIYQPDSLKNLVRHFVDPQVGFVVGHQRYVDDDSATADSESLYWRYETAIKVLEGRVGSVVCGDGAIYAIRSELFEPLRPDDINDFYLPLRIVTKGYRGVFDKTAICYERTSEDFSGEFRRKTRIVNRSLRAVCRVPQALNPLRVRLFAIQLLLHKVLRWFVPFFLAGALGCCMFLAWQGRPLYWAMFVVQIACYGLAASYAVPLLRRFRVIYVPYYFCLVNAAAAIGVLGFFAGRRITTWSPERSHAETAARY